MLSIIVPAHNEETVISRCLCALTQGAEPGEIEIIVACNGCTDRTADVARSFAGPVRVIEIAASSKIAALNAADQVASGFPRFYVDADVLLPLVAARRMADLMADSSVLLASPELKMDLSVASWPVRAFYQIWTELPYNRVMVGTGAYALSAQGRERFGAFPDLIADDGFVRFNFATSERRIVPGAFVDVEPPRTLWGLVKIQTRGRLGFYQLAQAYPQLAQGEGKRLGSLLGHFLTKPRLWPAFAMYCTINLLTRWRARRQFHNLSNYVWERDQSARTACAGSR